MRTVSLEPRWNHNFNLVSVGGKTALKGLKYEVNFSENPFLFTKEVWFKL